MIFPSRTAKQVPSCFPRRRRQDREERGARSGAGGGSPARRGGVDPRKRIRAALARDRAAGPESRGYRRRGEAAALPGERGAAPLSPQPCRRRRQHQAYEVCIVIWKMTRDRRNRRRPAMPLHLARRIVTLWAETDGLEHDHAQASVAA